MSDVKPALTAEEWADEALPVRDVELSIRRRYILKGLTVRVPWDERHGVAALCLHGQPFGFTREDVKRLRLGAESERQPPEGERVWITQAEFYDHLADRIEALLPPEGS